ncbi:MAG: HDIG domain-containing protein [Deltaproteobacteria bacterium]|nr:HDIG domain-containing protein [Deltaproteobacteria bacterium]
MQEHKGPGLSGLAEIDKLLNLKKKSVYPRLSLRVFLLWVLVSVLVGVLLIPNFTLPDRSLQEGEKSPITLKAQRSYDILDENATAKLKEEAQSSVRSVYDYDVSQFEQAIQKVFKAFERLKKEYSGVGLQSIRTDEDFTKAKKIFEEALGGIHVEDSVFSYFIKERFNWKVSWTVSRLLRELREKWVISEKSSLESDLNRGILIRDMKAKKEFIFDDFGSILDSSDAKQLVASGKPGIWYGYSKHRQRLLGQFAASLIFPNLSLNQEQTLIQKERAVSQVKPVIIQIKKNDVILRKGETIEKRHLALLSGIRQELIEQRPEFYVFFMMIFFFFFFYVFHQFSILHWIKFKPSEKDILLFGFLILVTLLVGRFYWFLSGALAERVSWLPSSTYAYLVPLAGVAMMARLLMGVESAILLSFTLSMALSLLYEKSLFYMIFLFSSCLVGINGVFNCRSHRNLYRAGLQVSLVNIAMVLSVIVLSSMTLHSYETIVLEILCGLAFAFLAGVLSAFVVLAFIPVVEFLFGYTTDIKLIELSNLNHPILRDLMIRSPGSYHHSMMVGTLAETAAEAIGADALLARVGGYYHDIGKMKNPHYYIENQFGGYNIHDRHSAHMSKTMIMSHVKEGVRIGLDRKLGKPVVEIIQQHHGTTAMMYFYSKAKKEFEQKKTEGVQGLKAVEESDFRYEGPKPQTVEAAIVMLADSVEAATRAMNTTHLPRLKVVCEKIVNRLFIDGQLDESDLTLKDLHTIVDRFYHVLVGVYHRRISYPAGGIQREIPYDANYNPRSSKEEEDLKKENSEMDEEALFKKMGA